MDRFQLLFVLLLDTWKSLNVVLLLAENTVLHTFPLFAFVVCVSLQNVGLLVSKLH